MFRFFKWFMKTQNTPTIKELRANGYKVRVNHYRVENGIYTSKTPKEIRKNYDYYLHKNRDITGQYRAPKGGKTCIDITDPTGRNSSGVSLCSPTDCFNRKNGNALALKRALDNLAKVPLPKN